MRAHVAIVFCLMVGACGGPATTSSSADTPAPTTTTGQTTTTGTPADKCPESVDYVAEGRVLRTDQSESDATSIGEINWEANAICERLVIDFETLEGAPATTPPSITVGFLETLQILRVGVAANDSIVIDQIVGTDLVDRLFVVKQSKTGSYIDFHLRQPVRAKARVSLSPARLIIDLQPGPQGFMGTASVSETAVMVTPFDQGVEPKNLEVSGYAMSQSGVVTVIATSEGRVVAQSEVIVEGGPDRWSEFRTRLDVVTGETTVFAGEPDPDDGSLQGVTVGIEVR